jgi:hypothetical protein
MKHGDLAGVHQAGPLGGLSGGVVELELLHHEQFAIGNWPRPKRVEFDWSSQLPGAIC